MLILIPLIFFLAIFDICTSNVYALTLEETIRKALETNPSILAEKSSQLSSQEAIDVARADYFPSLDVQNLGGYQYTREVSKLSSLSFPFKGAANRYTNDAALTFTQILFDGYQTINKVIQAESQFEASSKSVDKTEGDIALQACQAFFEVISKQALKEVARENIAAHEGILDKVKRRLEAGIGTRADVEQVEARLADAYDGLLVAEGELKRAIAVYQSVVGELPEELKLTPLPFNLIPKTLQETLEIALKNDPSILVAQKQFDVAMAQFNQTDAPFWPTFQVQADVHQSHNPQGQLANIGDGSVLLVGTYNFYRGGGDVAQMRSQREKVTEAKYRIHMARRDTKKNVMLAWADRDTSSKRINELASTIDVKKKVVDDYTIQFVIGGRFLLDILEAQRDYLRSKVEIITAKTVLEVSIAQLLTNLGKLAPYYKTDLSE